MSRVFAYGRVSTDEQTTSQQLTAIQAAGYEIQEQRWIVDEGVSGGVLAMERPAFSNLMENKLEAGDTLVISKLDRLGRDVRDVLSVVDLCAEKGIKLHLLDLPASDLTAPEGRMILTVIGAFAEFEKAKIRERTKAKLNQLKSEGVRLGRPKADTGLIQRLKGEGLSQSQVVAQTGLSLSTVKRNWKE